MIEFDAQAADGAPLIAANVRVRRTPRAGVLAQVRQVVAWYFKHVYGRFEGPNVTPWYCDPALSGRFAVAPAALATGEPDALFKLFVAFAMFQARRDTVILAQQRAMSDQHVDTLASMATVERFITTSRCDALRSAEFASRCTVVLQNGRVECRSRPGEPCHIKDATRSLKRTGDMGKLPSSAWLHAWQGEKLPNTMATTAAAAREKRGALLVHHFAGVHRVGQKLATMFVSALSTPALAPGLTPWFPLVDGNQLLVIDTNVARALDVLGCPTRSYHECAVWLRSVANQIDLTPLHPGVPQRSPRLVQQALFAFCSRSNRKARLDLCRDRTEACAECVPRLCPFVG